MERALRVRVMARQGPNAAKLTTIGPRVGQVAGAPYYSADIARNRQRKWPHKSSL